MLDLAGVPNISNIEETLGALWFGNRSVDEPVYLGLEDEFLQSCGLDPSSVASEISRQVVEELDLNKPKDIFYSLGRKLASWKIGDQQSAPPVLSIIGASILAAQNMHSDDKFSANAYYPRLAALLEHKISSAQLSAGFDDVVSMWEVLHKWIESNRLLGPSMISSLGGQSRIGFSRSQATINSRDRQILSLIKTKIGPTLFSQLNANELLDEMRLWAGKHSGSRFSPAFRASVDGGDKEIHGFLVRALFTAPFLEHDGTVRHSRRTDAEMWYDFTSQEFSWVVPKDPHLLGFVGKDREGHEICVQDSYLSEIWAVGSLPKVTAESLKSEHSWTHEDSSVVISKRKYWIFHDVSSSEAVMSFKGAVQDEQFSLLIPSASIRALLDKYPLDLSGFTHFKNVFDGWDFYVDIPCEGQGNFLNLISGVSETSAGKEETSKFTLNGGISIKSLSGSRTYLEGYEPDLLVDTSVGSYTLVLDHDRQSVLKATGHPLPISSFSSGQGLRTLGVPEIWNENYRVISAREAWNFSRIDVDQQTVTGQSFERKMLARRDRYYFTISEAGEVEEVTYYGQPTWLRLRMNNSSADEFESNFQSFVISIPVDCVWIVGLHETRRPVVERVGERDITIRKESVLACSDTWRTFLDLVPSSGIDELSILIYMVKGICK